MKENLKVLNIDGATEWHEVKSLFFSLGFSSVISGLTFMFTDKQRLPCRDITLPELRELAREKEYLNSEFELVVTNQPDDGWILVPDGAVCLIFDKGSSTKHFRNQLPELSPTWFQTLWQREENKVETVKGRFLHQWAYEAFGRGEDVQHTPCLRDCPWTTVTMDKTIGIFNNPHNKFRLKPQTIIIGSRTINKPISVKPESVYFVASITHPNKFVQHVWTGHVNDNMNFNRKICHLTKEDAIAMTDAVLELMK